MKRFDIAFFSIRCIMYNSTVILNGIWKRRQNGLILGRQCLERNEKMLMRSTGLGSTELEAKISNCCPKGDHLVLYLDTIQPVKWKIRCTMTFKDLKKLIIVCMKLSVLLFFLNIFRWFREPAHPGEF